MRRFPALMSLVLTASLASAQGPKDPIKLTVKPAPAPTPALRYKLLPEARELKPGNAATLYYRAFSPEWMLHRRPEVAKVLDTWSENMRQVPPEDLRWVLSAGALKELDRGARREYCNFEVLERLREDGIGTLLPDVQAFREFIRLLAVRARFEIAAGEWDKAATTLKTGFALSRHISEGGTLIHALVGVATSTIMAMQVEEWIAAGGPNLYNALSYLPRPMIDLRRAFEGERVFLDQLLPGVREALYDPKTRSLSNDKVNDILDKLVGVAVGLEVTGLKDKAEFARAAAKVHPEAMKTLLALGRTPEQAKALPVLQAVLMHEIYLYDSHYDAMMMLLQEPYLETQSRLVELSKELKERKKESTGGALAYMLLPAVEKVRQAQTRIEQRIAILRVLEAIRLHAAANKGKLPATLDEIKLVPLPVDPASGKPFAYKVDGNNFTLTATEMTGVLLNYSVTLKN